MKGDWLTNSWISWLIVQGLKSFEVKFCTISEPYQWEMYNFWQAYGLHVNGYVKKNGKDFLWLSKRSKKKKSFAGAFDNIVTAGQVPHSDSSPVQIFRINNIESTIYYSIKACSSFECILNCKLIHYQKGVFFLFLLGSFSNMYTGRIHVWWSVNSACRNELQAEYDSKMQAEGKHPSLASWEVIKSLTPEEKA